MISVGIVGNGFVGNATSILKSPDVDVIIYDVNPTQCVPIGATLTCLLECDCIFVCVPTPSNKDGSCYATIVESVVKQIKDLGYSGYIIIRSTVPVGTCKRLGCHFMPEFLTEKNYANDFVTNPLWIFGTDSTDTTFSTFVTTLINKAGNILHKDIVVLTTMEAEMIKYYRNCYLATKVSFANEMSQFCDNLGITYDNVRTYATIDPRIGSSHTYVPGHDGHYGYGGTCLPKDTKSLLFQIRSVGMKSYILEAIDQRNDNIDRPERDWEIDKGRAVVHHPDT